ncbi:hypothetical protein ACFQGT_10740 [Natrialbaceae archaeon GCM10025810]|uniref:hypothetical protein n=1 Tax=Halovalidus salilacus TaxID=3075124 RepID=UPI0036234A1E
MTDSTINNNSSESSLEIGPDVEELFGDVRDEAPTDGGRSGADESGGDAVGDRTGPDDATIEDRTAADVFTQLREESANEPDDGVEDLLDDESPEEIIASADEPDHEPEPVDDDLLLDEGELEALLLTGRTKEDEFLWIDSDESDDAETDTPASSGEGAGVESGTDAAATAEGSTDSDVESVSNVDDAAAKLSAIRESPSADAEPSIDASSNAEQDVDPADAETDELSAASDVETDELSNGSDDESVPEEDADEPVASDVDEDGGADEGGPADEEMELVLRDSDEELRVRDEADVIDESGSGGLIGWLRSKLGNLF